MDVISRGCLLFSAANRHSANIRNIGPPRRFLQWGHESKIHSASLFTLNAPSDGALAYLPSTRVKRRAKLVRAGSNCAFTLPQTLEELKLVLAKNKDEVDDELWRNAVMVKDACALRYGKRLTDWPANGRYFNLIPNNLICILQLLMNRSCYSRYLFRDFDGKENTFGYKIFTSNRQ